MGKITGFLEFARLEEPHQRVDERLQHFHEFTTSLSSDKAKLQGARCMDCGTPFCMQGCPIHNIIPDFNDLVYQQDWRNALEVLHLTNNFPEFTGRICPAPCEAACTLNINNQAVGIKSIEHAIADRGWQENWIKPSIAQHKTNKKIAIVGSGPSGLAAAQQLARVGHTVHVFEKNSKVGGLLRYGIPDFKLDKEHIDRRVWQMQQEGVEFFTRSYIGAPHSKWASRLGVNFISADDLVREYDAVLLCIGAEEPRDLPIPGRQLAGVHFAMEFLPQQNQRVAGEPLDVEPDINVQGDRVVVIGGGDTGSDCVGTSNRLGAASVTQFEVLPRPPLEENKPLTWPYWPLKLRTSSSHEEGCERQFAIATKEFLGVNGKLTGLKTVLMDWSQARPTEVPRSEHIYPVDKVFLAMGFVHPVAEIVDAFGVTKDAKGNILSHTEIKGGYHTSRAKVFSAGDARRGQSLVVWAIREGRQAARAIDEYFQTTSLLPR
ncbi:MAG: glutamate synthase subunit beta [Gammaproteobacteria bacterium]|nr:glutamate synthase subunit beta [Gammaproteobacteria bacterium]